MLAPPYPPIPGLFDVADARELCTSTDTLGCQCAQGTQGMGFFDIPAAIQAVGSAFGAWQQGKITDKVTKLEKAKLKAANIEAARAFAEQQADAVLEPYRMSRTVQIMVLGGVAVTAAIVSIMFLRAATRSD